MKSQIKPATIKKGTAPIARTASTYPKLRKKGLASKVSVTKKLKPIHRPYKTKGIKAIATRVCISVGKLLHFPYRKSNKGV